MHHSRLVGGLTALAVLLILSLAPVASAATVQLPPANPEAVTVAQSCLGVPFLAGGTTRAGFDSPGLARFVYARLGVWLPGDLEGQAARGFAVTRAQLEPGDLVFYGSDYHHVGIYVAGDSMIDAPDAGSVVSTSTIDWNLDVRLRRYDARTGLHAVLVAQRFLGVPYVFGGASPAGFDASGLTKYVFAQLGVSLTHGATAQQKQTRRIPLRRLRPGDLVFFGNARYRYHVGIYVGNGQMISAPHTGAVVSYGPISGARIGGRLLPVRRYGPRTGLRAVFLAQKYLGVRYVFGGASPRGFDASGLTKYVFAQLGVSLPHGATDQQRRSTPLPISALQPGDLVFFGNASYSYHVGIYVGNGTMIDAPHTGAVVRYDPIGGAWIAGRLLPVR